MATIIIKPKNASEFHLLQELFKKMKIKSTVVEEIEKAPNDETIQAIEDVKNGKTEKLTLSEFRKQLY
jgi:predicted nucleic acid-binding protein